MDIYVSKGYLKDPNREYIGLLKTTIDPKTSTETRPLLRDNLFYHQDRLGLPLATTSEFTDLIASAGKDFSLIYLPHK